MVSVKIGRKNLGTGSEAEATPKRVVGGTTWGPSEAAVPFPLHAFMSLGEGRFELRGTFVRMF